MSDNIERQVRNVMAGVLRIDAGSIDKRTAQDTISQWDSLNDMKLVLALEEEFGLALDEEQILQMTAFPRIVEIVASAKRK